MAQNKHSLSNRRNESRADNDRAKVDLKPSSANTKTCSSVAGIWSTGGSSWAPKGLALTF